MRASLYFERFKIWIAFVASLSTFVPAAVHAQDAKPVDANAISKAEAASPQALRARKSAIEAELAQLRADAAQKKREMEEVRLLELDVVGVQVPDAGRPASIVEEIERKPEAIRRELRGRASAALSTRTIGPFGNLDKYQTFAAKQLAVRILQETNKQRANIPKECDPAQSAVLKDQTLNEVVQACVDAVKKVIAEREKSPEQGSQQAINSAKSALATEIEALAKKIAASETLLREVDGLLATSNDLTEIIIKWTIPSLGAVLILILIAPRLYGDTLQREIFNQKLTLDLLTVYILVSTILILGLANRIQNEVLGTLLGGISGYVLGRSLGARQASEERLDERK